MIFIAHRGNISGKKPRLENTLSYVCDALDNGYNVEVDAWVFKGKVYLGHDTPAEWVDMRFLFNRRVWVHAKNIEAFAILSGVSNCFMHDKDPLAITTRGHIWMLPDRIRFLRAVIVHPELETTDRKQFGVCSDNVLNFREKFE